MTRTKLGIIIALVVLVVITGLTFLFFNKKKTTPIENGPTQDTITTSTQPQEDFRIFIKPVVNASDTSHSGMSDEEKKKLGLSLTEFDTDSDGLSDADEINTWHTDPKKTDTDGDGFLDGMEILRGYNPNGPGKL